MSRDYLYATTHQFKTHFSRYARLLREGAYRGVVVRHYKDVVGIFVPAGRGKPVQDDDARLQADSQSPD